MKPYPKEAVESLPPNAEIIGWKHQIINIIDDYVCWAWISDKWFLMPFDCVFLNTIIAKQIKPSLPKVMTANEARELQVKNSVSMSDEYISRISEKIKKQCKNSHSSKRYVEHGIISLRFEDIDKIIVFFTNQGYSCSTKILSNWNWTRLKIEW